MKNSLLVLVALTMTAVALTGSADAQSKKKSGGGSKFRVQYKGGNFKAGYSNGQHKFKTKSGNGGQKFYHNGNKYYHNGNKYYYNGKKQPQFKKHHYVNPHHYGFTKVEYVGFDNFPYRVCWKEGQYWVYYGNQWMPYRYMTQRYPAFKQWHDQHFFKQNHKFNHGFKK